MNDPRFVVREWSGGYVQVIDTANCRQPVREWKNGAHTPVEKRQQAQALARQLNDWDANTDEPLAVPIVRGEPMLEVSRL